ERAPVIVSTPASAQATSNQPGEATNREDSADTRKIPEPIIEPITIIVASRRLRPRTSRRLGSLVDWLVAAIRKPPGIYQLARDADVHPRSCGVFARRYHSVLRRRSKVWSVKRADNMSKARKDQYQGSRHR